MMTQHDGFFEDQIANFRDQWTKDQVVKLKDILTLKLYTDFDQLQYSLVPIVFSLCSCSLIAVLNHTVSVHRSKAVF